MGFQDRVFNREKREQFSPRMDYEVQPMDAKNAVIAVLMGICAGWLASWVVGGYGLFQYAVTGILGSFVGSYVLDKFKVNLGIRNEIGRDIATATIGAIIIMVVAHMLT
jgi:uncharacterized membrane protein YeaQ/YmgE (transglycosylase-associated protein family)